ncbi:MAG: amidohydrolase [Oscillospiraceae bacterium]|jgi:predicted TIM-barrel fold metal-dependent hydrolase|nr:amidohydrolase [Oscillospiraceae bacterium]
MPNIIDFHTHIFPDKIAQKATQSISNFYTAPMFTVGSLEALIQTGNGAGINRFVVQSVATTPAQVQSINNFISESAGAHRGEIIGLGAMHPDFEDIEGEIERIISLGLKGVKLHPDFQKFNIDDPRAMKIYEAMEGRLILLVHTGDYRTDYSHPRRLANVLNAFPKLDAVGAHFGGWSVWDDAIKYLLDKRCWVDTSSTFNFIEDVKRQRELVKIWGAERLLFGTDFPMANHTEELERLHTATAELSSEDIEKILYKNAEKLLKL